MYNKKIVYAGWSSLVARRAHNPEVERSNRSPATILPPIPISLVWGCSIFRRCSSVGLEQENHNLCVRGSSPCTATILKMKGLEWRFTPSKCEGRVNRMADPETNRVRWRAPSPCTATINLNLKGLEEEEYICIKF